MSTTYAVKIQQVMKGPGPDEQVVRITTSTGEEEVIVATAQVQGEQMIAWPLEQGDGGLVLIELPRETLRGQWRVWVRDTQLIPTRAA